MDVNYVLVIYGGIASYNSDDIAKFLWFPRIASAEFTHIREDDYKSWKGYVVGQDASQTFKNSMLYKMCYYRNNEVDAVGRGEGYDRVRDIHVRDRIKFRHFEEAFTSHNWIVRIYRVIRPSSKDDLDYKNTATDTTIQYLSGLPPKDEFLDFQTKSFYTEKLKLDRQEADSDFEDVEDDFYEDDEPFEDYEDDENEEDEEKYQDWQ